MKTKLFLSMLVAGCLFMPSLLRAEEGAKMSAVSEKAPATQAGGASTDRYAQNLKRWQALSEAERQAVRERARALGPAKIKELRSASSRFQALPAVEQKELRVRYQEFSAVPAPQRKIIKERFERFQKMPQEKREEIRRKFKDEKYRARPAGQAGAEWRDRPSGTSQANEPKNIGDGIKQAGPGPAVKALQERPVDRRTVVPGEGPTKKMPGIGMASGEGKRPAVAARPGFVPGQGTPARGKGPELKKGPGPVQRAGPKLSAGKKPENGAPHRIKNRPAEKRPNGSRKPAGSRPGSPKRRAALPKKI